MILDLAGERYGRLTVLRQMPGRLRGCAIWLCRCECGAEKITSSNMLRTGHAKSCGCLNREVQAETRHGMAHTRTWGAWKDMKGRCSNPNQANYARYGGRGIRVCERWLIFDNFLADMGARPDGLTLERIDNNGNYEPGNVRWASRNEQARNTRRNRHIEVDGRSQTLSEWARERKVSRFLIRDRLDAGMQPSEAVMGVGVSA